MTLVSFDIDGATRRRFLQPAPVPPTGDDDEQGEREPARRDPSPAHDGIAIEDPLFERREDDEPAEPVRDQLWRAGASIQ